VFVCVCVTCLLSCVVFTPIFHSQVDEVQPNVRAALSAAMQVEEELELEAAVRLY